MENNDIEPMPDRLTELLQGMANLSLQVQSLMKFQASQRSRPGRVEVGWTHSPESDVPTIPIGFISNLDMRQGSA